ISTEWTIVKDPAQFVLRYGRAMQLYLVVLLKNRHDAEDVAQEFFLRITRHGFLHARQDRGRFRDYLKVAVRNAALNFLRSRQAAQRAADPRRCLPQTDQPRPPHASPADRARGRTDARLSHVGARKR